MKPDRVILLIIVVILIAVTYWAMLMVPREAPETIERPDFNVAQDVYLPAILKDVTGTFSNARQYAAADDTLKITPTIGDTRPWINARYAQFVPVPASPLPGEVIALEWRAGSPDAEITRQRLWAFATEGNQIYMDFYSLNNPVDFTDMSALNALGPNDVKSYGNRCSLPMERTEQTYQFSIPETCRILSRSGRDMRLTADIILTDTMIQYREGGVTVDGEPVFTVPGDGLYYEFDRIGD